MKKTLVVPLCYALTLTACSGDGPGTIAEGATPIPKAFETDSDNDGVADNQDAFPDNSNESLDADLDGVGNNSDKCPEGIQGGEVFESIGEGSEQSPYVICNQEMLSQFSQSVNSGKTYSNQYIVLEENIDLLSVTDWNPIGNEWGTACTDNNNMFKGTFDGKSYTLSNLTINSNTRGCYGMFGKLQDATIKNLTLKNIAIQYTGNELESKVGAVSAYALSVTTGSFIESVTLEGNNQLSGYNDVGGIIGHLQGGKVSQSYTHATISGSSNLGGIAGSATDSYLTQSHSTADISGDSLIGGIVGHLISSTVEECSATGKIITSRVFP